MLLKNMYIMLKVKNVEEKILEITNSAINTTLNAKINQLKNIPNVTNLVTIIAVTSAGN